MMYSSRRRFLAGLIAAAVAAVLPQTAKSWTHGLASASGGKSILNLANPSFGAQQYWAINFFKNLTVDNSGLLIAGKLATNGTPSSAPGSDTLFGTMYIPQSYTGEWVLKWTGQCGGLRFDLGGFDGFNVTTGSSFIAGWPGSGAHNHIDASGSGGRVVFSFTSSPPPSSFGCYWLAGGTFSGMGNLVLCRLADEAALDAGALFNPDYISQITSIKPRTLRVMQTTNCATGLISKPSTYDTALTNINWSGPTYPAGTYAGTLSGTNTYTCSNPTDGSDVIMAVVANASTGVAATLNGITILDQVGRALNAGGDPLTTANGGLYTFTYDVIVNAYYAQAGGVQSFVPLSVIVALANQCSSSLYYCFNVLVTDAEVTPIATYLKANVVKVTSLEYSNELWGGVGLFNNNIAVIRAAALSLPAGYLTYQSLRHRQIMGIVTGVWTGGTPRALSSLKRVFASATFNGGDPGFVTFGLSGSTLGSYGYDTKPNRPVDYSDVLSYAPYYEGPNCPAYQTGYISGSAQQALYDAADNYASGNSTLMGLALDFVDGDVKNGTGGNGDPSTIDYQNSTIYPAWNTLAASYDSDRPSGMGPLIVECYEGGLQINRPNVATLNAISKNGALYGGDTGRISVLFAAYKNDARWQSRLTYQFNQFMAFDHSVSPCWYSFVGAIPIADTDHGGALSDQWSSHIGDLYSTPYKTIPALTAFNL